MFVIIASRIKKIMEARTGCLHSDFNSAQKYKKGVD